MNDTNTFIINIALENGLVAVINKIKGEFFLCIDYMEHDLEDVLEMFSEFDPIIDEKNITVNIAL